MRSIRLRNEPVLHTLAGYFVIIAIPLSALVCLFWYAGNDESGAATIAMAASLAVLSTWFVIAEARRFGGLTLVSCFVAFYAFVFGARAIYISVTDEFSIMEMMDVSGHSLLREAMAWATFGCIAFIGGAFVSLHRAKIAFARRPTLGGPASAQGMDFSWIFMGTQVALAVFMAPLGLSGLRGDIYRLSEGNAYVYLLPTIIHGFNLYFFIYIFARWRQLRNPLTAQALCICCMLISFHAYELSNMTLFRGVYLVGFFCTGVAMLVVLFGRVSVWFVAVLIAAYPFFKILGTDRALSNKEILETKVMQFGAAYTKEGLENAYGHRTDMNMIDTFAASLQWEHRYRGYFLSYAYILVHWVPRRIWPSKPPRGILSDIGYTIRYPFSPGIIGFFNDDGGKAFMLMMMFILGWTLRRAEIWCYDARSYEMYVTTFAALLLTALVTVRYLPYQSVYGFLVFYLPALICDKFIQRRTRRGVAGMAPGLPPVPGASGLPTFGSRTRTLNTPGPNLNAPGARFS